MCTVPSQTVQRWIEESNSIYYREGRDHVLAQVSWHQGRGDTLDTDSIQLLHSCLGPQFNLETAMKAIAEELPTHLPPPETIEGNLAQLLEKLAECNA